MEVDLEGLHTNDGVIIQQYVLLIHIIHFCNGKKTIIRIIS